MTSAKGHPQPPAATLFGCVECHHPTRKVSQWVVYGISRNALFLSRQSLLGPSLCLLCCLGCGEEMKWVTSSRGNTGATPHEMMKTVR